LAKAVAASKPSMTGIGLTALMRPHWSETALSIPGLGAVVLNPFRSGEDRQL
jgi:hypothetical protein